MTLAEAVGVALEALQVQKRRLAPEARLYQKGARAPSLKKAWQKYAKIEAAQAVLQPLGKVRVTAHNDITTRTAGTSSED